MNKYISKESKNKVKPINNLYKFIKRKFRKPKIDLIKYIVLINHI